MAFIIEQQAKFEIDIGRINESIARNSESIVPIHEELTRVNEGIRGLVEVARLQGEHLARLDDGLVTLAEVHNRLAQAQEGTDRRLNEFIVQVSRYLAGGNGRQRGPEAPGTK